MFYLPKHVHVSEFVSIFLKHYTREVILTRSYLAVPHNGVATITQFIQGTYDGTHLRSSSRGQELTSQ